MRESKQQKELFVESAVCEGLHTSVSGLYRQLKLRGGWGLERHYLLMTEAKWGNAVMFTQSSRSS